MSCTKNTSLSEWMDGCVYVSVSDGQIMMWSNFNDHITSYKSHNYTQCMFQNSLAATCTCTCTLCTYTNVCTCMYQYWCEWMLRPNHPAVHIRLSLDYHAYWKCVCERPVSVCDHECTSYAQYEWGRGRGEGVCWCASVPTSFCLLTNDYKIVHVQCTWFGFSTEGTSWLGFKRTCSSCFSAHTHSLQHNNIIIVYLF